MTSNASLIHAMQAKFDSFCSDMLKQLEAASNTEQAAVAAMETDEKNRSSVSLPDHIQDGFCYEAASIRGKEIIKLDAASDRNLQDNIRTAKNLVKMYSGVQKRANILAKFVATRFGGTDASVKEKYESTAAKVSKETYSDILPIGRLIGNGGLQRHRALLFKYLADRTVHEPKEWIKKTEVASKEHGDPIVCKLEFVQEDLKCLVEVVDKVGKKQFFEVDLTSDSPGLVKPPTAAGDQPSSMEDLPSENKQGSKEEVEENLKLLDLLDSSALGSNKPEAFSPDKYYYAIQSKGVYPDHDSAVLHAIRDEAYVKLGRKEEKLINVPNSHFILEMFRRNVDGKAPTVLFATSCISERFLPETPHTSFRDSFELIGEIHASEAASLENHFLANIAYSTVMSFESELSKLLERITQKGLYCIESLGINLPPEYLDPASKSCMAMLGIKSPSLPASIPLPGGAKMHLIPYRLLTYEQTMVVKRFGFVGAKRLAEQFAKEGTYHCSTLIKGDSKVSSSAMEVSDKQKRKESGTDENRVENPSREKKPNLGENKPGSFAEHVLNYASGYLDPIESVRMKLSPNRPRDSFSSDIEACAFLLPPSSPNYKSSMTVYHLFQQFAKPSPLLFAMRTLMGYANVLCSAKDHPLQETAVNISRNLTLQGQLGGWRHLDIYAWSAEEYEKAKSIPWGFLRCPHSTRLGRPEDQLCSIPNLQNQAEQLVFRMMERIEWVLKWHQDAHQLFDPIFCLQVLSLDIAWKENSATLYKETEKSITALLKENSEKFGSFKELTRKGVSWPHSPSLRKAIEEAGFVFRPMMIKRDHCVCSDCGVEVSGWRPWYMPWRMHNLEKHSAEFRAKAVAKMQEEMGVSVPPPPAPPPRNLPGPVLSMRTASSEPAPMVLS